MLSLAGLRDPQACRGAFSESCPYFRCRGGVAVAGLARQLHPRRLPRARVRLGAVAAVWFVYSKSVQWSKWASGQNGQVVKTGSGSREA